MPNSLDQLKEISRIAADTGDFEAMKEFAPTDTTTNPSIILAAASLPKYRHLTEKATTYGSKSGNTLEEKLENSMDMLCVLFGVETSKIIPGRVAIQVDPRLSFDKDAIIKRALKIIHLFENHGVSKERVLIKIGATWEGIQAAKNLEEKHGVHCNLTLMFGFVQAVACAEAGVTMLSPFVGGVLNWHKANVDKKTYTIEEHPGVQSAKRIYNYMKKFGYKTAVMGAYLTNLDEIKALAGCDSLTIDPNLLGKLKASTDLVSRKLSTEAAQKMDLQKLELTEAKFRWLLNEDQMAVEQLADGIRRFTADAIKLENVLKPLLK